MWLLIRARSNPKPTGYNAGDVVEIRPDDCRWGNKEGLPSFYRIQITDMPYSDRVQQFFQQQDQTDTGLYHPNGDRIFRFNRIRLLGISLADLPATARNRLQTDGILQVTKAQVRNFIKNNYGSVVDIDG